MLSLRTCIEMTYVIEKLSHAEVDRIFHVFDMKMYIFPPDPNQSKAKKANILLDKLKVPSIQGPFGNSFQIDMLQYLIDNFYRDKEDPSQSNYTFYKGEFYVEYDDLFSDAHKPLANSLKRDGYVVKGKTIKKLLPEEIEEARTENELFILLDKFGLSTTKGHLEQARISHSQGNWAAANSQFRPFIESLLIEICNKILPQNKCESAAGAIKLLGYTANPPFLRIDLNEIENAKCDKPFIEGLWKRLHPEGSHPGLSDEEDSTFRYHMVLVFAHYLLKRLEKRN